MGVIFLLTPIFLDIFKAISSYKKLFIFYISFQSYLEFQLIYFPDKYKPNWARRALPT